MTRELPKNILVDTCFLISLVNKEEKFHQNADDYFRHFMSQKTSLYISSITISEFMQKQDLRIIENFIVLEFGYDVATNLHQHFSQKDINSKDKSKRSAIKDDIKIIATCLFEGVDTVISNNDDFNKIAKSKGLNVINYSKSLDDYLGRLF